MTYFTKSFLLQQRHQNASASFEEGRGRGIVL